MYGGQLDDRDVSYVLSKLQRQEAIVKIGTNDPVKVKIPDLPDISISEKVLDDYLQVRSLRHAL